MTFAFSSPPEALSPTWCSIVKNRSPSVSPSDDCFTQVKTTASGTHHTAARRPVELPVTTARVLGPVIATVGFVSCSLCFPARFTWPRCTGVSSAVTSVRQCWVMNLFRFAPRASRRCSVCRYWQCDGDQEDPVLGECRIGPPGFNPLPGDPESPDTQAGLPQRPWPMTESADWCAMWRRIRGSIPSSAARRADAWLTAQPVPARTPRPRAH